MILTKPILYRRYVDKINNSRKKSIEDGLFKILSSYHKNIKLTIEINLIKLLDTYLHNKDGICITKVYKTKTKIIPKRYKRNNIKVDDGDRKIYTNFNKEELIILSYLFEAEPPFILLKLPSCEKIKRLH